ncbi:hypothetical protein [Simiduia agarivorans]|uniref:Lipoprotein n=1 Tax=Simiduia agarivorans (strain DSM 21679 / JCM 13881 / BCRC 17597 / SA1) TaxID=1117647 RepID=K4KH58_SIMAS|nr:hypothetical protein [Simiduia agarivorans]AFU97540.2 hypothetical protein M5M_01565 [Simiduia agarivorans SA1 = DSM 21679]
MWLYFRRAMIPLVAMLTACSQSGAPSLDTAKWLAFQARFCTESSELEIWETRDTDKLALLQSAFVQAQPIALDSVIKSPNHALIVVVKGEEAPETWHLTLRLDQETMALFNVKQPERSFQISTDPMLYRTLNTMLLTHMGDSLDIFRRCEMTR